MSIVLVVNNRAEMGPMQSVIAALPEATVVGLSDRQQVDDPAAVMGFGLHWFTERLRELQPRLVVVLGDRYETLSAALAATFLRIPLAHIHGGETTTGAFDDSLRDSITRMSTLHFVATSYANDRVYMLQKAFGVGIARVGDANIHLVGAPGLDGVPPQSALRDYKRVLVTYHPATMAHDGGLAGCNAMLNALCSVTLGYEVIFCGVNNDPGGAEIRDAIQDFVQKHGGQIRPQYTHDEYVELMQHAALVIGNSSAGVIEAPWVGVPSVNIGYRQQGRPMAPSVWCVGADGADLSRVMRAAMAETTPWEPAYRGSGVGTRIAEICRKFLQERGR